MPRGQLLRKTASNHLRLYSTELHPRQLERRGKADKLLKDDTANAAAAKWASHIFFAHKNGNGMQFCAHYLNVNVMKVRDSYPLSQIVLYIHSLGTASLFLALDTNSG